MTQNPSWMGQGSFRKGSPVEVTVDKGADEKVAAAMVEVAPDGSRRVFIGPDRPLKASIFDRTRAKK